MDRLNASPLKAGRPWPLGAHHDGAGINFALVSMHAQRVELCLFDAGGERQVACWPLPGRHHEVWHGYLPGAAAGLLYGFRVHGPWRPEQGHRFNPHKLLLDPYAREIAGSFAWRDEHFAHDREHPLNPDLRDNAAWALKARVPVPDADPDRGSRRASLAVDDPAPHVALADTILYELHVKGFSKRNPAIPEPLRGTFAGLAHPASISHLQRLGVTTVCLLPVQYALDEERLVRMGLRNYWGYNTLGFFSVDPRLASTPDPSAARSEFRDMVRALHRAGLEVVLDVVYNHSAETDEQGPCLSFRGLDNAMYYRLRSDDRSRYENHTGCGNSLDLRQPRVLQWVLDSLRYWVEEMGVDGFRFDLAPVLGRGDHGFDAGSAFFTALMQDPSLSRVKLIAEPWDIGPGGYRLGQFPRGWLEWNDQFRDGMRRFWLHGDSPRNTRGDFAMRLCGSSDLFQRSHRLSTASVNYVVSHDGFTLRDLVSYRQRHNQANGENNHDGHDNNLSFNAGAEGPSQRPEVLALRARLQRSLLACALLAQGTPMLAAGDELGHSQGGNNNPYCQDNETTWIDWMQADADLIAFARSVLTLRRQLLPFREDWYTGLPDGDGLTDLAWILPDGSALEGQAWQDRSSHALACHIGRPGRAKRPLLLLVNPQWEDIDFSLPEGSWSLRLDSTLPDGVTAPQPATPQRRSVQVAAHSLMLLEQEDRS